MMRRGPSRRAARRTVRRVSRRRVRMRRRRMILTGGMVAIAVAGTSTAIKLSQQDAQRIEQHTGKKPEDLTEDQLDQVIADLDIEAAELTDAEVTAIEAADSQPAAAPQPTPTESSAPQPPVPAPPQLDYITELKKLAELRDMGIITADDFEAKKKQLLGL